MFSGYHLMAVVYKLKGRQRLQVMAVARPYRRGHLASGCPGRIFPAAGPSRQHTGVISDRPRCANRKETDEARGTGGADFPGPAGQGSANPILAALRMPAVLAAKVLRSSTMPPRAQWRKPVFQLWLKSGGPQRSVTISVYPAMANIVGLGQHACVRLDSSMPSLGVRWRPPHHLPFGRGKNIIGHASLSAWYIPRRLENGCAR